MVEYCGQFLKKLEVFSLYQVEFCKDDLMELKLYALDCAVNDLIKKLLFLLLIMKIFFL